MLFRSYQMNIDTVRRLTKPRSLSEGTDQRFGVEMRLSGELENSPEFQAELLKLADRSGFDVACSGTLYFGATAVLLPLIWTPP